MTAPFTREQVRRLNTIQARTDLHPFTCGDDDCRRESNGEPLIATVRGWICPYCDYTQNWAHDAMPRTPFELELDLHGIQRDKP